MKPPPSVPSPSSCYFKENCADDHILKRTAVPTQEYEDQGCSTVQLGPSSLARENLFPDGPRLAHCLSQARSPAHLPTQLGQPLVGECLA